MEADGGVVAGLYLQGCSAFQMFDKFSQEPSKNIKTFKNFYPAAVGNITVSGGSTKKSRRVFAAIMRNVV